MTLGQVMQAASAFTIVQGAFGWLVDNYPRLAEWASSASRVGSLLLALDRLEVVPLPNDVAAAPLATANVAR